MTAWRRQFGTASGSSVNPAVTLGAAPLFGNFLVAVVAVNAASPGFSVASGWSQGTVATNSDSLCLFWKTAGVAEAAAQQPCTITSNGWCCEIAEYTAGSGWTKSAENAAAAGTTATHTSPTVTPTAGLWAVVVGAAQASTAGGSPWTNQQVNSSATGITVIGDQGANGTAVTLFDLFVSSTTGTYAAKAQAALGNAGTAGVAVFTYTPASDPPRPTPALLLRRSRRRWY